MSDPIDESKLFYKSFYTKQISIQDKLVSPTINDRYLDFLCDTTLRGKYNNRSAFVLEAGDSSQVRAGNSSVSISSFDCNKMSFSLDVPENGRFEIFQNYHHNWSAWVDKNPVKIELVNRAFIGIEIPAGKHELLIKYHPGNAILISTFISLVILIGLAIYYIFRIMKKRRSHD